MIKEINPTEEYLKAVTGKFDLETIFSLDLQNKSISKLSAIPNCTSLILLNLSKNKLTSVSSLSPLIQLNYLDLSFNSISSIDGIDKLINLRHLKLHGNNISKTPNQFSSLRRLEKLTFQVMPYKEDKELNTTNPLCSEPNYRKNMLEMFPKLNMLDGISRSMEPFLIEEDTNNKELEEKLNPSNFDFNFTDKINLNPDDIINDNDIAFAKKTINEKYDEFEKELEEVKKYIKEIQ